MKIINIHVNEDGTVKTNYKWENERTHELENSDTNQDEFFPCKSIVERKVSIKIEESQTIIELSKQPFYNYISSMSHFYGSNRISLVKSLFDKYVDGKLIKSKTNYFPDVQIINTAEDIERKKINYHDLNPVSKIAYCCILFIDILENGWLKIWKEDHISREEYNKDVNEIVDTLFELCKLPAYTRTPHYYLRNK